MSVSAVALFCEDIREEKSGMTTIVGVLPDNVNVAKPESDKQQAGSLSKLCIYVRVNFDPKDKVMAGKATLVASDEKTVDLGEISQAIIEQARDGALKNGNPLAGILTKAQLVPSSLRGAIRFHVEVTLGDATYIAGFVNFRQDAEG